MELRLTSTKQPRTAGVTVDHDDTEWNITFALCVYGGRVVMADGVGVHVRGDVLVVTLGGEAHKQGYLRSLRQARTKWTCIINNGSLVKSVVWNG